MTWSRTPSPWRPRCNLIGLDFKTLEDIITLQFQRKGQAAVDENVGVARAGYDYAAAHFRHGFSLPGGDRQAAGLCRRQLGAGHGRRRGRRALLLRPTR